MLRLPGDAGELAVELSRPLSTRDQRDLRVERVALHGGDTDHPTVVLDVTTPGRPGVAAQRRRVELPVSPEDLDPGVAHEAFVLTLRANLEEWWDTGGR